MSSNTLDQIRAKFSGIQPVKCDFCGSPVTVEQTKYFTTEVCEECLQHAKITRLSTCCNSENYTRVKFITSSGTIQVREQCTNCGNLKPNSIGGLDQKTREALPPVNTELKEKRETNYSDLYKEFYARLNEKREAQRISRRDQIRQNWLKEYSNYLNSHEWRDKREKVLKRDKYVCQACLYSPATQVHHKSYEFVDLNGSEPCFDLVAVCYPCHQRIEQMKEERRKSNS